MQAFCKHNKLFQVCDTRKKEQNKQGKEGEEKVERNER
jgi:hypothetical protein